MYLVLVTGARPTEAAYSVCEYLTAFRKPTKSEQMEKTIVREQPKHVMEVPAKYTKTSLNYKWLMTDSTGANVIDNILKELKSIDAKGLFPYKKGA